MEESLKQLLLKDLCARLPYGVIVHGVFLNYNVEVDKIQYEECDRKLEFGDFSRFETLKPYLRPMSSMTGEEKRDWKFICSTSGYDINEAYIIEGLNWLNAHHFDYRDLISKGLALEAPEGMYVFKTICNDCKDKSYCSQSEYVKNNCYKLK